MDIIPVEPDESWSRFCVRLLFEDVGEAAFYSYDILMDPSHIHMNSFVFGSGWAKIDPTVEGAKLRWYFMRDTQTYPDAIDESLVDIYRNHAKEKGYIS